jgi:hypothetical protein
MSVVTILGFILVGVGLIFLVASAWRAGNQDPPIQLRVNGLALQGLNVGLLLTILGVVTVLAPAFAPSLRGGQNPATTQGASAPTTVTPAPGAAKATTTTSPSPLVNIISLKDGQHVPTNINVVHGTSKYVPSGDEIWLAVIVEGIARFYPQNGPVPVRPDGDWTSPPVIFGGKQDVGRKFDLLAVLANRSAGEAFSRYLQNGQKTKSFPGLVRLPAGAVEQDRITVVRS